MKPCTEPAVPAAEAPGPTRGGVAQVVVAHLAVLVALWFTRGGSGGGWSAGLPRPDFITDGFAPSAPPTPPCRRAA
jgi:hypothetical protein